MNEKMADKTYPKAISSATESLALDPSLPKLLVIRDIYCMSAQVGRGHLQRELKFFKHSVEDGSVRVALYVDGQIVRKGRGDLTQEDRLCEPARDGLTGM